MTPKGGETFDKYLKKVENLAEGMGEKERKEAGGKEKREIRVKKEKYPLFPFLILAFMTAKNEELKKSRGIIIYTPVLQ